MLTVYHVGPNGWTKVWSSDTTDMFYSFYPDKLAPSVNRNVISSSAVEEEKKMEL